MYFDVNGIDLKKIILSLKKQIIENTQYEGIE